MAGELSRCTRKLRPCCGTCLDDVYDSGRTLDFARQHMLTKGASEVITCALARKPHAPEGGIDFHALEAPARYLVGYGMDDAGRFRGLPFIGALD